MSFYKPGVTTRAHATWECAFCKSVDYCIVHRVAHDCCTLDEGLCHSSANCVYHLAFTLSLCQWLEGWKIKLLDHLTRSVDAVRLEAFTLEFLHQIFKFLLFVLL